jgi:hypothetical protein
MNEITPIVNDQEMLRAYAETIRLKDAEIEQLKAERDEWKYECEIAYKAFHESNLKKFYEQMHQEDIKEHNRMMHEIAVLKSWLICAVNVLTGMDPKWEGDWSTFIEDLRKAAE